METSFAQLDEGDRRLERAIVLLLLADGQPQTLPRGQLATELEADSAALEGALDRLSRAGVVELVGIDARASRAARRIDELGLIGV
jgi:DNA-binding MarR family transcriptional regulator